MNFAEHCKAERRAWEAAFQRSTINPARAVECFNLYCCGHFIRRQCDTINYTSGYRQSIPPAAKVDRSVKGEGPVQATALAKRTRDGGEPEPARKRSPQGIRLTDSAQLRESTPMTAQVLALRASQGEGSLGSSSYPWMREDFKLSESRRDLEVLPKRSNGPPRPLPTSNCQTLGWGSFSARLCCTES